MSSSGTFLLSFTERLLDSIRSFLSDLPAITSDSLLLHFAGSMYLMSLCSNWNTHSSSKPCAGSFTPETFKPGNWFLIWSILADLSACGRGLGVTDSAGCSTEARKVEVTMISASRCKRLSAATVPNVGMTPPCTFFTQSSNFASSKSWPGRLIAKARWPIVLTPATASALTVSFGTLYSVALATKCALLSASDAIPSHYGLECFSHAWQQMASLSNLSKWQEYAKLRLKLKKIKWTNTSKLTSSIKTGQQNCRTRSTCWSLQANRYQFVSELTFQRQ